MKSDNYVFCSLGENCFPRTILTISGLKPRKIDGEKSMPFDLCVTPSSQVIKILKNNFNNYVNSIKYDKDKNQYFSNEYYIYFNHDTDCDDSEEGLEKIQTRYAERIKNFNELLASDTFIIFVMFKTKLKFHIKIIYKILREKHKNCCLIYLDAESKIHRLYLKDDISVVKVKHTLDNIDHWWLPENRTKFYELMLPMSRGIIKASKKYANIKLNEQDVINNCNKWYNQ